MTAIVKSLVDALYGRPVLLLVITAFLWSSNTIAAQFARGEITPMQHVLVRWILVTAVLWPFYGRQVVAQLRNVRRHVRQIVAMSVLGFTGFNILFYLASFNTTAVNIGILQGSMPMFVVIGAFLVSGTRVGLVQAVGVIVTLIGVAMVATRGAPWQMLSIGFNFGDLMMLAACASYSAYAVLLPYRPTMSGAVFFTMMSPIAMLTAIPPTIIEAALTEVAWPSPTGLAITLFVAIFPGTLAQQFFIRGVELIGPNRAGVFTNMVPVFAAALAVVILGEAFRWYHGVALALVLGGIALAQRGGPARR